MSAMTKRTDRADSVLLPAENAECVSAPGIIHGVIVGRLVSQRGEQCLVDFKENPKDEPLDARSVTKVSNRDVGRDVVLVFERGIPDRPIIIGVIQPQFKGSEITILDQILAKAGEARVVEVDNDRVEIEADREVVLKCGEASITLTRAGKILIKGAYVVTRSTGVNRIKGGSVQIN